MKTIRIHIKGDFQDGYIYGGQLFLIENNGNINCVTLWDVISKNLNHDSDEYSFFKLVFSQNNWLLNEQGSTLLKINEFKESFNKLWKRYSKIEYSFDLETNNQKLLHTLDTTPTLDFKIYGMRMFVGNRNGLYEAGFSIDDSNNVSLNEGISRVFDAKVTNLSAKSGSVMISSNYDGLYHGQMIGIGERLKVKNQSIYGKSFRSGWSGYDVVNYESQKNLNYLTSEFSRTEDRRYLFKDEAETRKISIDVVGKEIYGLNELLGNSKLNEDKIVFSFNSAAYCFFLLDNGNFEAFSFRKDLRDSPVKLSTKAFQLPKGITNKNKVLRPISSKNVPNGCVIEYFDQVILIHNNERIVLENRPVISIKTYPGSIRYKNIITIFDGDGVAIHSMYPF